MMNLHQVTSVKFSNDGRRILSLYSWGKAHVFDRDTRASPNVGDYPLPRSHAAALASSYARGTGADGSRF